MIFSAKETLYKLINPLANIYIDFSEGIVHSWDEDEGTFCIELDSKKKELGPYLGKYTGHFGYIDNNLYTYLILKN